MHHVFVNKHFTLHFGANKIQEGSLLPLPISTNPTTIMSAQASSLAAAKKFCTAVAAFTLAQLITTIKTEINDRK